MVLIKYNGLAAELGSIQPVQAGSQLGMERRDRALCTWKALYSPVAFLPIDHFHAGEAWRTVSIARGPRLGSNHYPFVVTLALTD
jgi:endonuclease/exonuclease/phosphatase (EEP) superfamily protein YafD